MDLSKWKKAIWVDSSHYMNPDYINHFNTVVDNFQADSVLSCLYYGDFSHDPYEIMFNYDTRDNILSFRLRNEPVDKLLIEVTYYSRQKDRQHKLNKLL